MASELYESGLQVRREVLGDEYATETLGDAESFDRPFRDLSVEMVWGRVWSRPELDRRTRSLVTLAMLTVLNRDLATRIHIKSALRNGATREEIREVFLQSAIYGGFPAALGGFSVAEEVFAEIDGTASG